MRFINIEFLNVIYHHKENSNVCEQITSQYFNKNDIAYKLHHICQTIFSMIKLYKLMQPNYALSL